MWIQIIKDAGPHKANERIDKEDAAAKTLIECGLAKACDAPKAEDVSRELLGTVIDAAVSKGFEGLRKELEPVTKKFTDIKTTDDAAAFKIPAEAKKYGSLKNFTGENADERAYRFGMYCLANYALNGRISEPERQEKMNRYVARAKSIGIPIIFVGKMADEDYSIVSKGGEIVTKASNENTNVSSAFLVPDEFQNDMIVLRERYGVFRKNAKIVPMGSDTRSDPRRRSGVTSYFVGEDQAGTQSTKNWDRVRLTAKKLMVLSKWSNELNEDSVINMGDDLAGEIAYSFAYTEDNCGFNGDGTSTYGGIVGARTALKNVDATVANVLGLVVASGTGYASSYGSIVLGDFNKLIGILPEYADEDGAKFYCSKAFWGGTMQRLAMAAGGNNVSNILGGARDKQFAGYDVVVSQVMPRTPAVNQVVCLFGNLSKAASLGDRRVTTISLSDVALNSWEQDELAIRGTERFDINVHDVGESSAGTARDSVQGLMAGPLVGLITAAA